MRCVRRNDHDAARFYLALFISDRDGAAALSLTRDRPIIHRFPSGFAVYPPAFPRTVCSSRHTTFQQTAAARD